MLGFKRNKKAASKRGEPRPKEFGREDCPLCKVSKETIRILKEKSKENKQL